MKELELFEPQNIRDHEDEFKSVGKDSFLSLYPNHHVFVGGACKNIELPLGGLIGRTMQQIPVGGGEELKITLDSWIYFFERPQPGGYVWIGRARNNDVVIPEPYKSVSGLHAYIKTKREDGLFLVDDSRFGTFLDGKRMQKGIDFLLKEGAEVGLAKNVRLKHLSPDKVYDLVQNLF